MSEAKQYVAQVCLCGTQGFLEDSYRILKQSTIKIAAQAYSAEEAIEFANDLSVDLVIVDADMEDALNAGGTIANQVSGATVLLASENVNLDILRRARAKGIEAVIPKPISQDEITKAYVQIQEENNRRLSITSNSSNQTSSRTLRERLGRGSEYSDTSRPVVVARQEVIIFYSPKGGVGKTTLTANLAIHIQRLSPSLQVLAIDLDIHSRLASLLEITDRPCIMDWEAIDLVDKQAVLKNTVRHSSGLYVLPGIERAINQPDLSGELVTNVIDMARRHFDIIFIDCGPDFYDSTIIALEKATKVFVIGILDIPTLRDICKLKEDFDLIGIDETKCNLVLNRVPKKPDLNIREVTDIIPYPLVAKIPEDPIVQSSVNRGTVPVLTRPDCPFSQEVAKLASGITPAFKQVQSKKKGLFSFLRRKEAM